MGDVHERIVPNPFNIPVLLRNGMGYHQAIDYPEGVIGNKEASPVLRQVLFPLNHYRYVEFLYHAG